MAQIKKQARNPERARERFRGQNDNWGTVTFEFEVSKAGKLLDIRITNDGGYAPFGEEVEEATRIASRYFGSWSKYGSVVSVDSWTFKRKLKFPLY
jgi:TonB family protein